MGDSIGHDMRRVTEDMIKNFGQTIIIHKDYGTPQASTSEVRGMQNSPKGKSSELYFGFLDQLDLPVGTMLQVKGSRDFWRVVDTYDEITNDIFVCFNAYVEKADAAGTPTRPQSSAQNIYHFHGANSRVNISSNDLSVNISNADATALFDEMRKAVAEITVEENYRQELLDRVEDLEKAKGTPRFVDSYKEFMSGMADHIQVFQALSMFIPALTQLLPHS